MKKVLLKDIKKGEFFTLKPIEYPTEQQVYIRDSYDRTEKKYECYKFNDVNAWRYLRGNKEVYTDFIF